MPRTLNRPSGSIYLRDRVSTTSILRGFGSSRFYGLYRDAVWGLKIGFRGVIFPGSGCIYLETVQYGCFCLKIPEIVADIYIGTVQTSARENIS